MDKVKCVSEHDFVQEIQSTDKGNWGDGDWDNIFYSGRIFCRKCGLVLDCRKVAKKK